ncbi:hypothetical protein AcW1_008017 [Taiwanofungus camphoratus]|nr:hypothetical protein AcV5_008317 [Antrodia cinnamomea]KAI0950811.1 hypothetical protein AcW1_008017 [Antrodia cinnamomea]KAI0955721.1 hypothetical protein AcV7_006309 [Antrodia cinnamomea]
MSLLSRLGPVDEPALCLNTTRSLIDRLSEPVDDQPLEEDQLNVGEGFHKSADVDSQLQPEPSQFSGSGNRRSKTRSNSGSIVLLGNHSIGAGPRDTEHQNVLPASDLAADNLVAHLSKLDVINKLLQSMNATSGPADKSPPHPPPLSTLSPSSPEAMEECRRLMIPQLVQNAWLRDRSLDRNALERRVRELLTDEWCTEMVQSAKEVMSQMLQKRAGEAVEVAGECAAGLKRPREADDQEGPPRGAKSQRLESLAGASAGETTSSTSPDVGKAKSPGLLDTTILDSAVRAMEDYLDRSSVPKVNTQLASSAKSSSPTDIPTSVPISGRAEGTTAKGDGDRLETDDARHDSVARSVSVHSSPTPNCNHALHPTDIPTSSQQMEHNTQSVPVSPQPNSDAVLVDGSSAMAVDEQDTNLPQDHSEAYAPSPPPLDRVPGLWCVTVGSRIPDITDVSFEAEDEVATAAQRWVRRHKTFEYVSLRHVLRIFGNDPRGSSVSTRHM